MRIWYMKIILRIFARLSDSGLFSGKNENKYRILLEHRMNEIFKTIYDGNIRITIDPKYRINVNIQEEFAADDEVEKNTAQGYALIFAFVCSLRVFTLLFSIIYHTAIWFIDNT